jgi:hypothetical protein
MKLYEGSYSQANQESFVLNALKEKRNGFYLEIGGYHSKYDSNTYLLEKEYDWSGVALEIDKERSEEYNQNRVNKCLNVDAITFNYLEYFENNNFPKTIDYLQIDIEPANQTLAALKALPLDKYRFSIVTFEHDLYADPNNILVKQEAFNIFNKYNYKLIFENVEHEGKVFEDWWADSNIELDWIKNA